jgi:glucose uptake protein
MIPTTLQVSLVLAAAAFACWGSWAILFKAAGPKWRFEHFYFDFAFGGFVASLIAAFTAGSSGEGLTFSDAFLITGRKQWAQAAAAGAIFNLGNMLLLAAVEIAGMAVAIPIAMAVAATVMTARTLIVDRGDNPAMLIGGAVLLLLSVILVGMAAGRRARAAGAAAGGNRKSAKAPGAAKPVTLAAIGGLLIGLAEWPLALARTGIGELNMGPYALAVLFTLGILVTAFIYNLYFINLPVHGEPAGFGAYFQGGVGKHLLGILGGAVFAAGVLASFIVAEGRGEAAVSAGLRAILVPASAILAAAWGLLAWREFRGADGQTWAKALLGLVFMAAGLAAVAIQLGV